MTREKRTDYAVVNALGTTLFTSPDADLARAWVKRNLGLHPSARVERVTIIVERECWFKPRPARKAPEHREIAA
jgi:hypothetical protein